MRTARMFGAALALVAGTVAWGATEEELKSGLQVGQRVGPYQVVKCGGAADDGVKDGQQLCYV